MEIFSPIAHAFPYQMPGPILSKLWCLAQQASDIYILVAFLG